MCRLYLYNILYTNSYIKFSNHYLVFYNFKLSLCMFIDTHSHIYSEEFISDISEVINRAKNHNITKIVLPDIDSETRDKMLILSDSYPNYLYPLIGLHPTSVNSNYKSELLKLEHYIKKRKVWGIGETGIDLYWDKTYIEEQIKAFCFQIELSLKYNLPIIIHARDSIKEIYDVLETYKSKPIKGIMHCFSGDINDAQRAINYGLSIGIGGVLTFKNSNLREIVSHIDIKNIVLETDSPYLAPVPYRGKRNESSYIVEVANKLASIYNISIDEVGRITSKNACEIFNF